MGKIVTTTTHFVCDMCNKAMHERKDGRIVLMQKTHKDSSDYLEILPAYTVGYGFSNSPYVCDICLVKHMKEWIKNNGY